MIYFCYNDLLKPSNQDIDPLTGINNDLLNFQISLDKRNGYDFNKLINILNDENMSYEVSEGFNYDSNDKEICEFKKISFVFKNNTVKDINSIIKKYGLDGIFNITNSKKEFTFIIK
jgi:hypothetical protein